MFEDSDDVVLDAEGQRKLGFLNKALSESKCKGKSIYTMWVALQVEQGLRARSPELRKSKRVASRKEKRKWLSIPKS